MMVRPFDSMNWTTIPLTELLQLGNRAVAAWETSNAIELYKVLMTEPKLKIGDRSEEMSHARDKAIRQVNKAKEGEKT